MDTGAHRSILVRVTHQDRPKSARPTSPRKEVNLSASNHTPHDRRQGLETITTESH